MVNVRFVAKGFDRVLAGLADDDPFKKKAAILEEELQLTAWNITENFLSTMEGKGKLQLSGFADPSGRGEGIVA